MASGIQSGIITRPYKSGSIIYFENDKSEYIYILKSGRVLLSYTKIDTGEEIKEEVRQGEFFGVKSALGKYPREETAQTIGETVVLVLAMADFERLILKNVNVVRKMLRVFSNQLRRIGKNVRTVLGESENVNPDVELFRIGEHYFKAGDFIKASYAFKRYMEYYPDTEYAKVAMERIRTIGAGGPAVGSGISSGTDSIISGDDEFSDFSMDDEGDDTFSFDESPSAPPPGKTGVPSLSSELSSEMDDFLSDSDDSLDDFGDFSFDDEPDEQPAETCCQDIYDEAMSHFNMDNYTAALASFKQVIEEADPDKENDEKILTDALYYGGLCNMELKKYKESMAGFADIIKNHSGSDRVKESLFAIGQIFEKAGQKEKAIAYYNKVLNIPPGDSVNSAALDKIKVLQKDQV